MAHSAVIELAKEWIRTDPDGNTRTEIEKLLSSEDYAELDKRLSNRIVFGTAGLRGRMAAGYSCMNALVVQQASQGLCEYVLANVPNARNKGIIVGYDGRYHSREWAFLTAAVFSSKGFKVYAPPEMIPTPFVAFGVLFKRCACGVMVTASHNPKEDNGYKVYWENGAQIIPPHDTGIHSTILANLEPWPLKVDEASLTSDLTDLSEAYYKLSDERYCFHRALNVQPPHLNIVYTPMHGVGLPFALKMFSSFGIPEVHIVPEQAQADPEFPTVRFPNPEEKGAMDLAIRTAERKTCTLIVANDPDADRLAAGELQQDTGHWKVFGGNEMGLLLGDWIWWNYLNQNPHVDRKKCVMLASTASSKVLGAVAAAEGFLFEETLTGFKWLGNRAIELEKSGHTFLFAYEVEIGFCIGNLTFDKDGVRAAAIFAEMATYYRKRHNQSLAQRLDELYLKYGLFINLNEYLRITDQQAVQTLLKDLTTPTYKEKCGPFRVKAVRDLSTGYDSSTHDKRARLPSGPLAGGQVLTFYLKHDDYPANEYSVLIRSSGTEPKLKYYLEASGKERRPILEKSMEALKAAVLSDWLCPAKYGLLFA